jgi:ankyrin repeat protein
MYWSQDLIVFLLFPYLLPSLPIYKEDCWSTKEFRHILEYLLISFCNTSLEITQNVLEVFIRRTLLQDNLSCFTPNVINDLEFLVNIENRDSFKRVNKWKSSTHFLYASSFLIEHKANIHVLNDRAISLASQHGYKEVVALLLKHKANMHVTEENTYHNALVWASQCGNRDVVTLLLEHKADIHAHDDNALKWACENSQKDVVVLLLKCKANIHAEDDYGLRVSSEKGYEDIVAVLLEHKADVHVDDNFALRYASKKGYIDVVALLLEHKADVYTGMYNAIECAHQNGHKDVAALLLDHVRQYSINPPYLERKRLL